MDNLTGQQIDNYRIDRKLGEGGMGAVYQAFDLNLNRLVAFKVTHTKLSQQPEFQQRFLQEARAGAKLDHPSIVKIFDFGNTNGVLWMVMEYLSGGSLASHLKQTLGAGQRFDLRESLVILAQTAEGLAYAHRQGVVHRDIKPDNIMLKKLDKPDRPGDPPVRAVVTDLGLAKLLEGGIDTSPGAFMGTMAYMSPEQVQGHQLDGRSDIYSLGIVLYQMATGRLPFEIHSPTEAVTKHLYEAPPPPESVRPDIPPELVRIINLCLAKQTHQRYNSADALANDLRKFVATLDSSPVPAQAAQSAGVSLATQVEAASMAVLPSRMGSDLMPGQIDQLIVARHGQQPRTLPLNRQSMVIGRNADTDIHLPDSGLSRKHARISRTSMGWSITDLGSTNGTLLEGSKLLPNITEAWEAGQTVQIGPYYLRWQPAQKVAPVGGQLVGHSGAMSAAAAGSSWANRPLSQSIGGSQMSVGSQGRQINVNVTPSNVTVAPGQRVDLQIMLSNQGNTVAHYRIALADIPQTWITIPQDTVQLMPHAQAVLSITVHPPHESSTRAGAYPFRLNVVNVENPVEKASMKGTLTIKAYVKFTTELHPSRIAHGGASRIRVKNDGNTENTFTIIGRDPAEAVHVAGHGQTITVEPGDEQISTLKVKAKKRPILGAKQTLPFSIAVESSDGTSMAQNGQLDVKPLIPRWIVSALTMLLILGCIGAALAYTFWRTNEQNEIASATATAEHLQQLSDNDGDGLTNQEELALGTEIDNPDTDGDGLSDYEEAKQHGTDPMNRDSDNDTLPDGQELANGTNPMSSDTDGDGLADNVDPDPGNLPTHTPPPEPTELPTQKPTTPPDEPTAIPTTPPPPPTIEPTDTAVPGVWDGVWESQCEFLACDDITLTQSGDNVQGTYANGNGTLVGEITGSRVSGEWELGGGEGTFDFWISEDGKSWQGNWDQSFAWCGFRSGETAPSPCGISRWYGEWTTVCGAFGCDDMRLIQDGEEVLGIYAGGDGRVEGTVKGSVFTGTYQRTGSGTAEFFMLANGEQFTGNWDNNNEWCGFRSGASEPTPCFNDGNDFIVIATPAILFEMNEMFIIETPPAVLELNREFILP